MRLHAIAAVRPLARRNDCRPRSGTGQMITVAIITAAAVFGLAIAVIAVLQAGISREEADHSLLADPATRAASVTRRLVGLYGRTPDRPTDAGRFDGQHGTRSAQQPPTRPGR